MAFNLLKPLILAVALVPAGAVAASDLPPLAQNERVKGEFLAAAIGDEIRENCPTISARMFYAFSRLNDLRAYAKSLGYTNDDIDEMRKNPENKAELRRLRDRYLQQNGVVAGNAQSYCRLGQQEIANRTLVGSLLRAR